MIFFVLVFPANRLVSLESKKALKIREELYFLKFAAYLIIKDHLWFSLKMLSIWFIMTMEKH